MTYTVFGTLGPLGRTACHQTVEGALAEICKMNKAGFGDIKVAQPYRPPLPADAFLARQTQTMGRACDTCQPTQAAPCVMPS